MMTRNKWILPSLLVILSLPFLLSLFDESNDVPRNPTGIKQYGMDDQTRSHRIPRKQYFGSNHDGENVQNNTANAPDNNSNEKQRVMDQVLANDLSHTTSFFIAQLQTQLERWSNMDISEQKAHKKFKQQLQEHKHFKSFGLIKAGELQVEKGNLDENKVNELLQSNKNTYYSDPYMSDGKQCMLLGKKRNDDWLVGEIDLSFIKGFVGELASVADANGNFFISSGGEKEVKWNSTREKPDNVITQTIPELDWQIVLHSGADEGQEEKEYREGEVLVQFKNEMEAKQWIRQHRAYKIDKQFGAFVVISNHTLTTNDIINELTTDPRVIMVEPNYIFTKQDWYGAQENKKTPNDEFFIEHQWNLSQISAEQGWQVSNGSKNIIVSYLDTGVDRDHEDLKDKIKGGFNTFDKTRNIQDNHGHGTHVAGIIGAVTNNVTGIAGLSWQNPILPIKVLNEKGEGSIFEIASGIKWATDNGAKVINMSLGDSEHSELLYDAIRYAYERDVVLIAAAGNDNVGTPMYPAGYEEVMAVSAVNKDKTKAQFSNYGDHIDVAAPGENIPSTFLEDQYVYMSGTSMAAPHVTGMASLIRSLRPDLTNDQVMDIIRDSATDIGDKGHDPYYGYGLINVQAALENLNNESDATYQEIKETTQYPVLLERFRQLFR